MDDCERLYRRLVHNVRANVPDLLTRPFEVAQVYQQLVSYRENRSALGFASNDQYELALLQLLSGARGFLEGEPEMQHALRAELETPNPDLTSYRAFATAAVRFGAGPLRDAMLRPTPEGSRTVTASPADQIVIAARPTESVETPPAVPLATVPAPARRAPLPPPPPPAAVAPPMPVSRPSPSSARPGPGCRYCGGGLPDGRDVVFCPNCGHNLTVKHCPACNTELEVEWKYCITCGRENEAQASA